MNNAIQSDSQTLHPNFGFSSQGIKRVITKTLTIEAEHPHFEGHFPGFPVLPAVSQVNLVMKALRESLDSPLKATAIRRAKFRAVLRPNTTVHLEVVRLSGDSARWVLRDETVVYSMGEISFRL